MIGFVLFRPSAKWQDTILPDAFIFHSHDIALSILSALCQGAA